MVSLKALDSTKLINFTLLFYACERNLLILQAWLGEIFATLEAHNQLNVKEGNKNREKMYLYAT
jgi:hypothetical protein